MQVANVKPVKWPDFKFPPINLLNVWRSAEMSKLSKEQMKEVEDKRTEVRLSKNKKRLKKGKKNEKE